METRITFDYYYGRESSQYSYYQVPQVLIKDEYFKNLSTDAKLLYSIMLNRMRLSQKKGWIEETGRVYIYYTVSEIITELNCCKQKAVKLLAELDSEKGIGLIERIRQGQGKPDKVFVKHFARASPDSEVSFSDFQRYDNQTSRSMKIIPQEVHESDRRWYENHTSGGMNIEPPEVHNSDPYIMYSKNDIENNDLEYLSINQSAPCPGLDTIDRIRAETKALIEYDIICEQYEPKAVYGILELIVEILMSEKSEIIISGCKHDMAAVKDRFRQIDRGHVEYVLDCMSKNTTKIHNIMGYLLAALFRSPLTIEHYYQAEVRHNMNMRREE